MKRFVLVLALLLFICPAAMADGDPTDPFWTPPGGSANPADGDPWSPDSLDGDPWPPDSQLGDPWPPNRTVGDPWEPDSFAEQVILTFLDFFWWVR